MLIKQLLIVQETTHLMFHCLHPPLHLHFQILSSSQEISFFCPVHLGLLCRLFLYDLAEQVHIRIPYFSLP